MSLDHLTFLENPQLYDSVAILGVPLDLGKDNAGTDSAPDHLRQHRLVEILTSLGLTVNDLGNIPCETRTTARMGDKRVKYLSAIVSAATSVANLTHREIKSGKKSICLGGDHSLSLGTISGAAVACGGNLGLIYIDAHGDMMTSENTLSGNIHGMPSAALLGWGHPDLVNIFTPGAKIKKENMLYVGLKDLDQAEIDLIRREKLRAVTMMDIIQNGLGAATAAIAELQTRVANIWVSLDIDSIDYEYAPATFIVNHGGFTYREITALTKYIGKTCRVAGMDLVELVPQLDKDSRTADLAIELIVNTLGGEYGWYTRYMQEAAAKQARRWVDASN